MPWFGGHRTLAEQMLGLDYALAEADGKRVLDAGCAEALIGIEFVKRGATVVAFDNQWDLIRGAVKAIKGVANITVAFGDINGHIPEGQFDIVLALAVLHKTKDMHKATKALADRCTSLMVVRLPRDSTGRFKSKHFPTVIDLNVEMPKLGFELERTEQGPQTELVQYWRRK